MQHGRKVPGTRGRGEDNLLIRSQRSRLMVLRRVRLSPFQYASGLLRQSRANSEADPAASCGRACPVRAIPSG